LKKKLKDKLPAYESFEASFVELAFSNNVTKQKKLIQYILAGLDRYAAGGVTLDYDGMTIEHLAAQSGGLDEETFSNIGNLLLCDGSFNSEKLGTKSFQDKKAVLLASKVEVDSVIKKASHWSSKEIKERAKHMANIAYNKVWKI
jgi:hypothetical protein